MKLLLDQNISRKLIPLLREEFPGSAHVSELDLPQSKKCLVLVIGQNGWWNCSLEGCLAKTT